ncbi:DUF1206 domain-containing protein, partial [Acidimicrobiaceae bacterium USS-CC1]|nr:DUF1206 domain-containing protein [Acidiferrimicrobium australe]
MRTPRSRPPRRWRVRQLRTGAGPRPRLRPSPCSVPRPSSSLERDARRNIPDRLAGAPSPAQGARRVPSAVCRRGWRGTPHPVTQATATVRLPQRSAPVRVLARLGIASRGLVYLLLGWLVLSIVVGGRRHQASDKGAFQTVAAQPGGKAILLVLAVGFGCFALWAASQVLTRSARSHGAGALARRVGAAGQAVVYGFLCYLAAAFVVGAGSGSGSGDPAPLAAAVMRAP